MPGTSDQTNAPHRFGRAEHDIVALGIATAAIILFVSTGSTVLPQAIRGLAGVGLGPEKLAVNALLLNIALIIFGWRRYRQLALEVVERRRAEEQEQRLAQTDPLTGCLNRRSIGPATDALITQSAVRGEVVALLMIDLDHFKQINDYNGHSAGDAVLEGCARRIELLLPDGAILARLGGDEFAAATAFDPRRAEAVDGIATAILEAIAKPFTTNGITLETGGSIGIARSDAHPDCGEYSADRVSGHTLMHMADIAMYHAKKRGRGRYFWFEASMESELRFRGKLEAGLRNGIPRGEFVPYYEQQIDLQTGELTGFEMLARWNSPELGLVNPTIFIPIAEEIGLISELSECLIRQALEDARRWDPRLTLAVNISPLQLRDQWFAQKLLKLLVEANFPPHRLEIEITESCLHDNMGMVRSLIASLKNQGIRVSIDDFGIGYSSLAQLRTLPFDRIKIDRSFVSNLANNRNSAAIVQAVTQLGRDLGLPITAEGVETREVLHKLLEYGDIKGQGYFYGRPQPAAETHRQLGQLDLLRPENGHEMPPAMPAAPTEESRRANGL
ncbi:MAG: EAL domain-containing protein [Novosphingobium sp.]|nr:EAL domain-containing protein [Novosphingobium sp.]